MSELHTVIGSRGAVGQAVMAELKALGLNARALTSRDADARDSKALRAAVAGSTHLYVCLGIAYDTQVWKCDWPRIIEAVIAAAKASNARIIFLDNIYMYGPGLDNPILESHRQKPSTRKGKIRKQIADRLMQAHAMGEVKVLIGRAPDFYGPGAVNSVHYVAFLENMLKGKAPQTFVPRGPVHTYGYVPDLGRALVRLARDEATFGEVWHLPVGAPVTLNDIMGFYNAALGTRFKPQIMPKFMASLLSLFIPTIGELIEMQYQFTDDYVLSDKKFRSRYPDFAVMPYAEAIKQTVAAFRT